MLLYSTLKKCMLFLLFFFLEFGILHGIECPKFRLDPDSYSDEEHTISSINGALFITSTRKSILTVNIVLKE